MDKIKVHGLEVFAYHGVFDEEKKQGQTFIIDCEFCIDTSVVVDDLEKTVHYGEVSMDIVSFCQDHCFDLIEMLANSLAKFLLKKYALMEELTLTIHKPQAPIPTSFRDVTLTVTRRWVECFLGVGSNLGDCKTYLDSVREGILEDECMEFVKQSSYKTTKPYGVLDQPDFLNAVIKVKTLYTPNELLRFCQSLESATGRVRARHWGERTLDVDILTYGQEYICQEHLKIPHPEMLIRDFVMEPLLEIEPSFVHPRR